jgi:endo-1,4-beta-mannosidase
MKNNMTWFFKNEQAEPLFWIGSNYWPGYAGIEMWKKWKPQLIYKELTKMAEMGFTVNRSFLFMPDFMQNENGVNGVMLSRFNEFLTLCQEANIGTIPTFFVGHMSGEDWDVPWRNGRNFYTDPDLRKIQKTYIKTILLAAKKSSAIRGWLLSNEISNYEPNGTPEEIADWAKDIINYIKKFDSEHPVCIGDGAWAAETSRRLKNFHLRKLAPHQDFIGLHFYPRSGSPWHQSFTAAFRLNLTQFWGKPVIVEEFGHSAVMGSEENQAHYYRIVLYSSLINGAKGVMNWCFADFDLPNVRPYSHHPFEMQFGLINKKDEMRLAGHEMSKFAQIVKELIEDNWKLVSNSKIGLLIPSNYYYEYPHDWDNDFEDWYNLYLDTFCSLKRTNLTPKIIFEPSIEIENNGKSPFSFALDPREIPVLILPRFKRMTAPFWKEIKTYVQNGGVLYTSFAQDNWIPDWEEFFGISSYLKFGIPQYHYDNQICVKPTKPWGNFSPDDEWVVPLINNDSEFAYCPMDVTDSDILLAATEENIPLLVHRGFGKGHIYFSSFPLEMLSMKNQDNELIELLQKLYQSLWDIHGFNDDITFRGKDIEYSVWWNKNNTTKKMIFVNHSWDTRKGKITMKYSTNGHETHKSTNHNSYIYKEIELSRKQVLVKDILTMDNKTKNKKEKKETAK